MMKINLVSTGEEMMVKEDAAYDLLRTHVIRNAQTGKDMQLCILSDKSFEMVVCKDVCVATKG